MNKILASGLMLLIWAGVSAQDATSWKSFRGNQKLQGYSNAEPLIHPILKWRFKTVGNNLAAPAIFNGILVTACGDGNIYGLDLRGQELWRQNIRSAISTPIMIFDQKVYAGALDGSFFAFNLYSGEVLWTYHTEDQIIGAANWWKDDQEKRIVVGSYDHAIHCLDATSGYLKWKFETGSFINGTPAIIDDRLFFGSCDGFFRSLDIRSGKLLEKIKLASYLAASPALSKEHAFVGDYDGQLSCLNFNTSQIVWQYQQPRFPKPFLASPATDDSKIVIANKDGFIFCLDRINGNCLWTFRTGGEVEASVIIIQNKVLTVNMQGAIHLLDLNNGKMLWQYELACALQVTPACIDRHFFVAGSDGEIYCFGTE